MYVSAKVNSPKYNPQQQQQPLVLNSSLEANEWKPAAPAGTSPGLINCQSTEDCLATSEYRMTLFPDITPPGFHATKLYQLGYNNGLPGMGVPQAVLDAELERDGASPVACGGECHNATPSSLCFYEPRDWITSFADQGNKGSDDGPTCASDLQGEPMTYYGVTYNGDQWQQLLPGQRKAAKRMQYYRGDDRHIHTHGQAVCSGKWSQYELENSGRSYGEFSTSCLPVSPRRL